MRARGAVAVALVVGIVMTGVGYAVAETAGAGGGPPAAARGPGTVEITIAIRNSRFEPSRLTVWEGTQVRLTVRNTDPIGHELIVGDDELHRRHRSGSEAAHPPVPGEVSLGPGQTGATVVEADSAGTLPIVCHLPGHERYGMVGELVVLDPR